MSPEHLEKMRQGRIKQLAEKKAIRARLAEEDREKGLEPVKKVLPARGETREEVVREIERSKKKIIRAQIDIATGYSYETDTGRIYTKVPNGSTGEYLLNQLIGKPKESIDIKTTNLNIDL